ncbi:helix-turn-helix domain-containing protein [Paenibacillus sp. 1P07SE]|uniref:helix-turn-helix domain-containing protein n=1 Tax=Paenibacillus sp. 1P07SE TaxID=3132209 RepID=UPI0039A77D35
MRRTKGNLLLQFLVSYLLVFLLPVASILLYYYPNSTQAAKEKEMAWNMHVTEQFKHAMDIFSRYVYDLPYELMRNRDLKMYLTPHDDYHRYVLANEMRKYNATDGFIYNTLLYVKDVGYLFSKTGNVYTVDDFNRKGIGYSYTSWPHKQMFAELDKLSVPEVRGVEDVVIPGNNRARLITFLLPMPQGGEQSPGVLLIQVLESTVVRMVNSVSDSYNGAFFIFDEQGQPLVSTEQPAYSETPAFEQLVSELKEQPGGTVIHSLDGKSYIVSHSASNLNGWQYVSLLPLTESLQSIRTLQWNSVLMFILILLVEVLVIYISLKINYEPIKRLVKMAADVFQHHSLPAMNEVETIRYTLDQLSSDNSRLDEEVRRSLPIVRVSVLFDLVSGHFATWDEFQAQGDVHGITRLSKPCVTAAILSFADDPQNAQVQAAIRREEDQMAGEEDTYLFASIYPQEYVYLCSHEEGESVLERLTDMQRRLADAAGAAPLVGVGQAASTASPEGAHHSYLQALRAAEHLRMRSAPTLLAFEDIEAPQSGSVSYSAELLQSLEMAIIKNESAMVRSVLERLMDYMNGEGMPPYRVRSVYANTVSILLSGLQRFRQDDANLLRLTDAVLQHTYTIAQMAEILRETSSKLCDMMDGTMPAPRIVSAEEIMAMLESKAYDPDFSLQFMADHFGMSLSGFSYHFKKTVGHNFKESVDRMRIQRSLQLLRETEDTLVCIAEQVGYTNASSFIRSFKKIVGTTPGQYRETHK